MTIALVRLFWLLGLAADYLSRITRVLEQPCVDDQRLGETHGYARGITLMRRIQQDITLARCQSARHRQSY